MHPWANNHTQVGKKGANIFLAVPVLGFRSENAQVKGAGFPKAETQKPRYISVYKQIIRRNLRRIDCINDC